MYNRLQVQVGVEVGGSQWASAAVQVEDHGGLDWRWGQQWRWKEVNGDRVYSGGTPDRFGEGLNVRMGAPGWLSP